MSLKDRRALFLELTEARFMLFIGQTALVLCWTGNKRPTGIILDKTACSTLLWLTGSSQSAYKTVLMSCPSLRPAGISQVRLCCTRTYFPLYRDPGGTVQPASLLAEAQTGWLQQGEAQQWAEHMWGHRGHLMLSLASHRFLGAQLIAEDPFNF